MLEMDVSDMYDMYEDMYDDSMSGNEVCEIEEDVSIADSSKGQPAQPVKGEMEAVQATLTGEAEAYSDYSSDHLSEEEYEEERFEPTGPIILTAFQDSQGSGQALSALQPTTTHHHDTHEDTPYHPPMPHRNARLLPLTLAELESSIAQPVPAVSMDDAYDNISHCIHKLQQMEQLQTHTPTSGSRQENGKLVMCGERLSVLHGCMPD